jgi:hypothetical protein
LTFSDLCEISISVTLCTGPDGQPHFCEIEIPIVFDKPSLGLESMENKTIFLGWNGKHNGNLILERINDLLVGKEAYV